MPREWDAASYARLELPHEQWGARTRGRLSLRGDETVLDAGCGTGRETERLLDLLPDGRVVALDGSAQMLDELRIRLADRLDRVDVVRADLTQPLPFEEPVDHVLSVATFHWIDDHDALFRSLAAVLRPGGLLVSDCGGEGNIAAVNRAIAAVTGEPESAWDFASVDATRSQLNAAGFGEIDVQLRPAPYRIDDPRVLREFLGTVVLGPYLDRLPEAEHAPFVDAVAEAMVEPVVDYVRLEITARR